MEPLSAGATNENGELGDGTTKNSSTPVEVQGVSDAIAIANGETHCAIIAGGTVECWGYNAQGELGNGTTESTTTPVAVSALSNATAISAGYASCAVVGTGSVECWGHNEEGAGTEPARVIPRRSPWPG